jgi:hypothetical protein
MHVVPFANPVPLTVEQTKQLADEPVPTMKPPVPQPQALFAGYQVRALDTQVQVNELALVLVKAVVLLQVKQE